MSVTVTDKDAFLAHLRQFCGPEWVMERDGLDPVNEPMIRHWCEALGDTNPIYTDPSTSDGIVAPPTMIGAWTMRPLVPAPPHPRDGRRALIAALDDAGFTGIVATNTEQEYVRYLRPGDRIKARIGVESVGEEKGTALGVGHFFVTTTTYLDQNDEVVATERFRMLKFKPAARATSQAPAAPARRPRPSMNQDSAFFWEAAEQGQLLIQRCTACGTLRHPPRAACSACRSLEWDTLRSAGDGAVYSYVVYHHPPAPGFEVPYVVALVDLDEGVRMLSNVISIDPEEVKIGMRVAVSFVAVDDELTLPQFRPA